MGTDHKSYSFQQSESHPPCSTPLPSEVINEALAQLQPDRSVIEYDDDENEHITWKPNESVDFDELTPYQYSQKLLELASSIHGAVGTIAFRPEEKDKRLKVLAHHLTAYLLNRAFIDYVASSIKVDERGGIYAPQLPKGFPEDWVPQLKEELTSQSNINEGGQKV